MTHDIELMRKISDRLATLPQILHKTDKEIADTMGVTLRTFRKYCREPVKLKVEYVVNLIKAYPITIEYIVGDTEFPYVMTEEMAKLLERLVDLSEAEIDELLEKFEKADEEGKRQICEGLLK